MILFLDISCSECLLPCLILRQSGLQMRIAEFHADHPGDAALGHGDAVDAVRRGDRLLVVGDHDELGGIEEPLQNRYEAADIGLIQGGIELIQYAERRGAYLVDGEKQRHGGHGLLPAGEEGYRFELFARRPRHDLDARLQDVALIYQAQLRMAPLEEGAEHVAEVVADFFKRLEEHLAGLPVDLADDFQELRFGLNHVILLGGHEVVALLKLFIFFDGDHVDGAHLVDSLLELLDEGVDIFPIQRRGLLRLRCGRCVGCGREWIVLAEYLDPLSVLLHQERLGDKGGYIELVALSHARGDVIEGHLALRDEDVEGLELFFGLLQAVAEPFEVGLALLGLRLCRFFPCEQLGDLPVEFIELGGEEFGFEFGLFGFGLGESDFAVEFIHLLFAGLDEAFELGDAVLERVLLEGEGIGELFFGCQADFDFGQGVVGAVAFLAELVQGAVELGDAGGGGLFFGLGRLDLGGKELALGGALFLACSQERFFAGEGLGALFLDAEGVFQGAELTQTSGGRHFVGTDFGLDLEEALLGALLALQQFLALLLDFLDLGLFFLDFGLEVGDFVFASQNGGGGWELFA